MSRLVFQPSVHAVASTVLNHIALRDWALAEGLGEIINASDTPLSKIEMAAAHEDDARGEYPGIGNASLDRVAEFAARHCYRSWEQGREIGPFVENIIDSGHGSVLRHATVVLAISGISRTLSLELIRHHVGADVSQESQRYVEAKDIRFVVPPLLASFRDDGLLAEFERQNAVSLADYEFWIDLMKRRGKEKPGSTIDRKRILEAARSRLPNCAETRLVWTMNTNAMRNIIAARGSMHADLEIRRLAVEFLKVGQQLAPHIFADFRTVTADDGFEAVMTMHPKI